jgi:hypothetical protein
MARGTIIAVGAAVVALGLGAWFVAADSKEEEAPVQASGKSERKRGKRARPDRADAPRDVDGRLAALEDEVASLRREVKALRMGRGVTAPRAAFDDEPEATEDAPAFEGAVRDIIETEREEARERRTDAMQERFSERHGEILDELVATAGLKSSERESIQALWETEAEQIIPLIMSAREGDRPFGEVREEAEKLRGTTDAAVEEMLTAEQFEQYKEMRPGPPGRRRGGDRRGGPR